MKKLFDIYQKKLITHPGYKGVICGYTDVNFILAVEGKEGFRKFSKNQNTFILEEYKDAKYRYIFEDEREVIKQSRNEANI